MAVSIYTTAFFVRKNNIDYKAALTNFSRFLKSLNEEGEIKIAIPYWDMDSYNLIYNWAIVSELFNISLVSVSIETNNPSFDGLLKNEALQSCGGDICIQMDMDERFIIPQTDKWKILIKTVREHEKANCLLIPSINVWGDLNKMRWDNKSTFSFKQRIHKKLDYIRGVVKQARLENGAHDIEISDGTELLQPDGTIAQALLLISEDQCLTRESYLSALKKIVFIVHLGYLDLSQRIYINNSFWKEHWGVEAGKEVDIEIKLEQLQYSTFDINLFTEKDIS